MSVTDDDFSKELTELISWMSDLLKVGVKIVPVQDLLSEDSTLDVNIFEKIRWLATNKEIPKQIFNSDATVDDRILSKMESELLCWVKEQSISITNHRYGNIGADLSHLKSGRMKIKESKLCMVVVRGQAQDGKMEDLKNFIKNEAILH